MAARALAGGAALEEATARAGYRSLASASLHVRGDLSDGALRRVLLARFCHTLTDPALRDLGYFRRASELWVVLAQPFTFPALQDPRAVEQRVLQLVNAARARGTRCGTRAFPPAAPLRWSARLARAAEEHSADMAGHGFLSHRGRDGSTPAERASRAGYAHSLIGENIAAGVVSADEAVRGWLASPAHCENIMEPRFSDTAVAFRIDAASAGGIYWTQLLGAPPRRPQPQRDGSAPGTKASAGRPVRLVASAAATAGRAPTRSRNSMMRGVARAFASSGASPGSGASIA